VRWLAQIELVALVALTALLAGGNASAQAESFELGVEAYRRGAYAEADAHWQASLELPLAEVDRARVLYDLGNAAWRRGEFLIAVGWYTLGLELEPRDADLWHNLELARASAELEPADRGDLSATFDRITSSLRPAEARFLAAAGLALLALVLLGEALRGGHVWRRLAWTAFVLAGLVAIPWLRQAFETERDRLLVVRAPSVTLRSEPRLEREAIASLPAGTEVVRIDALPGWVRVRTPDGERGWLQADALFALTSGGTRDGTQGGA